MLQRACSRVVPADLPTSRSGAAHTTQNVLYKAQAHIVRAASTALVHETACEAACMASEAAAAAAPPPAPAPAPPPKRRRAAAPKRAPLKDVVISDSDEEWTAVPQSKRPAASRAARRRKARKVPEHSSSGSEGTAPPKRCRSSLSAAGRDSSGSRQLPQHSSAASCAAPFAAAATAAAATAAAAAPAEATRRGRAPWPHRGTGGRASDGGGADAPPSLASAGAATMRSLAAIYEARVGAAQAQQWAASTRATQPPCGGASGDGETWGGAAAALPPQHGRRDSVWGGDPDTPATAAPPALQSLWGGAADTSATAAPPAPQSRSDSGAAAQPPSRGLSLADVYQTLDGPAAAAAAAAPQPRSVSGSDAWLRVTRDGTDAAVGDLSLAGVFDSGSF